MGGYIKLHRGWHDSCQFADEPYCERAAWCWLLTNAAWKDTKRRNHRGEVVDVLRGQYHTSLRVLATEWRWSIKRVRTFLNALEKCGSLGTQRAQGGTIITICNYNDYQSIGRERGTTETPHGARKGHTQEEGKERKEDKGHDAGASSDKVFWETAKAYLGQSKAALIGKWVRDYGREETAKAIAAAQVERAVDPVSYIARILQKRGGEEEMTMPC